MNQEQVKSGIRWFITTFGGVLAGYFAAWSGWFSADQIIGAMNSPAFLALTTSVVMGVWGLITHTKGNMVSTVAAMPEVKEVKLEPSVSSNDSLVTATPSNVSK